MKALANISNFSSDVNHGALITFSNVSDTRVFFSEQKNSTEFNQVVDSIEDCRNDGATRIIPALKRGLTEVFQHDKGMRKNTTKVVILLTDGGKHPSETVEDYEEMGQKYLDRDINFIVIGIGGVVEAHKKSLLSLVQTNTSFFLVQSWDDIDPTLVEQVIAKICLGKNFFVIV